MQCLQIKNLVCSVASRTLGAAILITAVFSLLVANRAEATITFQGAANASAVDTTVSPVVIYGGTAGYALNPSTPGTLVDTCIGMARLGACNNAAIYEGLALTISFTSDSADGIPYIEGSATNGGTNTPLQYVVQPVSVTHPGVASVTVLWSTICDYMVNTALITSIDAHCNPLSSGEAATYTFNIGITGSTTTPTPTPASGTTAAATSDSATITITIAGDVGQTLPAASPGTSVVEPCNQNTPSQDTGICHFEVGPGDQRVILKTLYGSTSFPNLSTVPISQVALLWIEGQDNFSNIGPPASTDAAHHTYLPVTTDGTTITVSPYRIDGFNNDQYYSFKIGLVDKAGNIGYFTNDDADQSCIFTSNPTGTECHVAEPGEVVGVLSKDINCFVATAAYGSPMAPEVDAFRKFRNAYLLPTKWGRRFVHFYYKNSPYYAAIIAKNESLRTAARAALWPLLGFAKLATRYGLLNTLLSLVGIVFTILATCYLSLRLKNPRGARA